MVSSSGEPLLVEIKKEPGISTANIVPPKNLEAGSLIKDHVDSMSGSTIETASAAAVSQADSSPENRTSASAGVSALDGQRDGTPLSTTGSEGTQHAEFRQPGKERAAYLIKWGRFDEQLSNAFSELFCSENFADVTLACDGGEMLKAHKIILAMSSPFFRRIFTDTPCKHPIVVLKEFTAPVMKNILQYLYMGKVVLSEHEISSFMDAADFFGICGVIPDTYSCDIFATTIPDPDQRPNVDKESQSESGLKLREPSRTSENEDENDGDEGDEGSLTPDERTIISHSPVIKYHFKTRWTRRYSGNSFSGPPSCSSGAGKEHKRSASAGEVESIHRSSESPEKIPRLGEKSHSQPCSDVEMSGADDERIDDQSRDEMPTERRIIQRAYPKGHSAPMVNLEDGSSEPSNVNEWKDSTHNYQAKFGPSTSSASQRAARSSSLLLDFIHPLQVSVDPTKQGSMYKGSGSSSTQAETSSNSRYPDFNFSSHSHHQQTRNVHRPERDSDFSSATISSSQLAHTSSQSNEERFSRYHPSSSTSSAATSPTAYRPQENYPHRHFSLISSQAWPYQQDNPHRHRFNLEEATRGNVEGRYRSDLADRSMPFPNVAHSSRNKPRSFPVSNEINVSVASHSQYPMLMPNQLRSPPSTSTSSVTRPKTKAIRSSQVPQSSRYTAAEVDQMVDAVANYPGNIVPCTLCQKFVKRERLRAHIHECHLLSGEKIICPHCGIALKSKGSFRVHIWRHKRGALPTRNAMSDFSRPPSPTSGPASN